MDRIAQPIDETTVSEQQSELENLRQRLIEQSKKEALERSAIIINRICISEENAFDALNKVDEHLQQYPSYPEDTFKLLFSVRSFARHVETIISLAKAILETTTVLSWESDLRIFELSVLAKLSLPMRELVSQRIIVRFDWTIAPEPHCSFDRADKSKYSVFVYGRKPIEKKLH